MSEKEVLLNFFHVHILYIQLFQSHDIFHSQNTCRVISCPNGAIRTSHGCTLYAKAWYKQGYLVHLIMTPTSDNYIRLDAFRRVIDGREPKMKQWLDSKGIKVDSIRVYADLMVVHNVSYMRTLNVIVGEEAKHSLIPADVLKTIQSSLNERWRIKVDDLKYYFNVAFDIYGYYVQNGNFLRVNRLNPVDKTESTPLPKVYDYIYEYVQPIPPFYITKMFFCEQVTLLPEEWRSDYQGIWLNLTGTGNGSYLGDAEFNLHRKADGTWQVQICVEDFKSELAKIATSVANLIRHRISCLVLLSIYVINNFPWNGLLLSTYGPGKHLFCDSGYIFSID